MNIDIKKLSEDLKSLSIAQISDLLKQISGDLGIDLDKLLSSSGATNTKEVEDEKKEVKKKKFNVSITALDISKQIAIIQAIKALKPDLTFMEIKKSIGDSELPFLICGDLLQEEAEELKKKWENIGCTIKINEEE